MPQLIVRNIEEKVVRELRLRAAADGVSVEEEHRRILREALLGNAETESFRDYLLAIPKAAEEESPEHFERQSDLPRDLAL